MILETHDLSIGYTKKTIASRLNLTLQAGELVCLLGQNGAGKSTLIRTLAGMQPPLNGRVLLNGDDVRRLDARALARRLGVVLTERADVGMLSVHDLVALGRYPYTDWMSRLQPEDKRAVNRAIESVGASELAYRPVSELSDGERQKVMIARALAQEPALMILDEPTAFLDLPRRAEIMFLLRDLARESGRAILLSTHDLDLALRTADRVWLLANGTLTDGAPEDLVLSGAFASAFQSEGVSFNISEGAFHVQRPQRTPICLSGDGVTRLWMARALERAGFEVVDSAVDRVEIITQTDSARFRLHYAGVLTEYESIYALIAALRDKNGVVQRS